jgi:hypothetical protein
MRVPQGTFFLHVEQGKRKWHIAHSRSSVSAGAAASGDRASGNAGFVIAETMRGYREKQAREIERLKAASARKI